MPPVNPLADSIRSSHLILGTLVALVATGGVLYYAGAIGAVVAAIARGVRTAVSAGFRAWERYLAWAPWFVFLALELACLAAGVAVADASPSLAAMLALGPLWMGVTACLAYMFIDVERYEVERGYKTTHEPQKGQEFAAHVAKYDQQVRVPLLLSAAIGAVGGFALLNLGLANGWGRSWYTFAEGGAVYADFLVYSLINLYSVVDLLDLANSRHVFAVAHVRPAWWPASALLVVFKTCFTLVLLQQIFASIRKGRVLTETISDFWSPHEPIHLRARAALPIFGAVAASPLLASLRTLPVLTKEQRDQLPLVLAALGPSAVPLLRAALSDPIEHLRAVAVAALGQLRATDTLPVIVRLHDDPSDVVRLSVAEALGVITAPAAGAVRHRSRLRTAATRGGRIGRLLRWGRVESPPPDPLVQTLATLRRLLEDPAAAVRAQAAVSVGGLGVAAAPCTPALIVRLADDDETVRCGAADALGRTASEDPAALDALVGLLSDPSPDVQAAAAEAVAALRGDTAAAVPALVPLLQNVDSDVRQAAAEAIGRSGPLSAATADALTAGLASADNVVRAQAAEALGTIGTAAGETAPALVELLFDVNDHVRAEAVTALSKIGPAASMAVPGLMRALRDVDNWVSALAAEALGEMGPSAEGAVPALVSALRHTNPHVRGQAALALGKLGPLAARAVPALARAAADEDGGVRTLVVEALGTAGRLTPEAARVVRGGLDDKDPRVRAAAVEALGRIGVVDAALAVDVQRLLDDPNDLVKAQAALALPRLSVSSPAAIEGLALRLSTDDSVWVQGAAARALGEMGTAAIAAGPALVRAARTAELSVRTEAMRALALVQPPEACEAFASGLADVDPDVRILASAGWRNAAAVPDEAVPRLVEALGDSEDKVRANAAYALARLAELPTEAVPLLVSLASDSAERVRLAAALSLRAVPSVAGATLTPLLDDPSARVRLVAAGALLADAGAGDRARDVLVEALASDAADVHRAALALFAAQGGGAGALLLALRERPGAGVREAVWAELAGIVERLAVRPPEVGGDARAA